MLTEYADDHVTGASVVWKAATGFAPTRVPQTEGANR